MVETVSEAAAANRLAEVAATAWELTEELRLRAWLFDLAPRQHIFLLLLHHIAGDGWSMVPLARDLARAYAARIRSEAPDWGEMPIQYADYALWQRDLLGDTSQADSLGAQQL